jgi:hypothetical protein
LTEEKDRVGREREVVVKGACGVEGVVVPCGG